MVSNQIILIDIGMRYALTLGRSFLSPNKDSGRKEWNLHQADGLGRDYCLSCHRHSVSLSPTTFLERRRPLSFSCFIPSQSIPLYRIRPYTCMQ